MRLNDDNQLLRNNERRLREELEIQRDDTSALMRKYTEDRKKIEEDNEVTATCMQAILSMQFNL